MKTRNPYRYWIFAGLLIASPSLLAQQPAEQAQTFQAPDWQSAVQGRLQLRLEQRLSDDMDQRFAEMQRPGNEDHRLAESELPAPAASPLPQSLQQPAGRKTPRITLPARLPLRFGHNGASFI